MPFSDALHWVSTPVRPNVDAGTKKSDTGLPVK